MKLGLIKRISKEDMAKADANIPKWVDPMLETLNLFIEKVTQGLSGNLVFGDNFLCKEHTQVFASGAAYTISPQPEGRSQVKAYGVWPIDCNGNEITKFLWSKNADNSISVTLTFTDTTASPTCTLIILSR